MHTSRCILAAFLCICLASACRRSFSHLPPGQMEALLLDIHLAESYSALAGPDSLRKAGRNDDSLAAYYRVIFRHYGITAEQFAQSMEWYRVHPDDMDTLYSRMMPDLSRMQGTHSGVPGR